MQRPPNVLFLMSDEHRADAAGFAGNPVVRTPTLDALAAGGVTFTSAYTPSPICIPARQCMAAGQLPRTCGVERFGQDLPPFSMTFARRFAQHAYDTVCCGKLHHVGLDQMQGWTSRIGSGLHVHGDHIPGFRADLARQFSGGGDGKWSDAKEIQRAGVGVHPSDDAYTLDGALRFIEQRFSNPYYDRLGTGRPLLLKVSFSRPHYPYFCSHDRFTYYLHRVQPFLDEPVFDHPFLGSRRVTPGVDVTQHEIRRATAAYYGMIEEMDADFGRLLDALRHHGQDPDDWLILYTSDHGEMLGEHGVWEKQKFFEASAKVPLVVRPPRRQLQQWGGPAGRRVTQNVNLCDLFATLCDLCDVPPPDRADTVNAAGLDSRSLVPLMRGDTAAWTRDHHDETVSQFGGTNLMIKRGPLKYQLYSRPDCAAPEHREVLFDLDADPTERTNLTPDPRYQDVLPAFRARARELHFSTP